MLIKCRYCGKKFDTKQLARHLKAKHQIEYKEYLNEYWQDIPGYQPCEVCGTMIYIRNNKTCSDKCYKIYQSDKSSGRIMPPRSKRWRQLKSKSQKEKLKNPENHPMYGKTQSEESNQKNSKSHKEKYKNGWSPNTGKKRSLDARANMSEAALLRAQQSDYTNPMQGKTHSPEVIKKIFSHRKMNKTEKIVADIFNENNIKYQYQFFLSRNGICKSFDFKIKGRKLFIEVDGDYWHGGPGHKYEYFKGVGEVKENDIFKEQLAKENGFEVIRVWESEIKKDKKIIMEKLNEYI